MQLRVKFSARRYKTSNFGPVLIRGILLLFAVFLCSVSYLLFTGWCIVSSVSSLVTQ